MRVRRATRDDRSAWKLLRGDLWPSNTERDHREEMESYLREKGRLAAFLAERSDGSISGFIEVSLRPDPMDQPSGSGRSIGYLEGLFVHRNDRRRGTARALIRAAEDWAKSKGAQTMGSQTNLQNRASRAVHRTLRYRERKRLVVFEKRLR